MSTSSDTLARPDRDLRALAPGVLSAVSFGCSDILTKLALMNGSDALTLACIRGVLGTLFITLWLRHTPPRRRHTPRERWITCGIGLLFAFNLWLLFVAVRMVAVPIAILSYFIYPLLTGVAGAALGLERLGVAGAAAALVALLGLALLLGTDASALAWLGILFAVIAALCRVATLLITRAALADADSRMTTWYSMLWSTLTLLVIAGAIHAPQVPHNWLGWGGVLGVTVCSTTSMLALFASTVRIGAFRTALVMNLEPVVATLLSMLVLGELLTPPQLAGGAVMLAALCAFQLRRG